MENQHNAKRVAKMGICDDKDDKEDGSKAG